MNTSFNAEGAETQRTQRKFLFGDLIFSALFALSASLRPLRLKRLIFLEYSQ